MSFGSSATDVCARTHRVSLVGQGQPISPSVTGRPAPRAHFFLDSSSRNPRRLNVEFPHFGMRTGPLARADPQFIHRPVTPGVAGSSPVHSAKPSKGPIRRAFCLSEFPAGEPPQ